MKPGRVARLRQLVQLRDYLPLQSALASTHRSCRVEVQTLQEQLSLQVAELGSVHHEYKTWIKSLAGEYGSLAQRRLLFSLPPLFQHRATARLDLRKVVCKCRLSSV